MGETMSDNGSRTDLATHEVTNQPPLPGDFDLFGDPAMAPAQGLPGHDEHLAAFGKLAGSAHAREKGRLANENKPKLRAFDARGRRIDEIDYHPAYHELMQLGLQNGVAARAWTHPANGQVAHAALGQMMAWADTGVGCPMTMTYAVVPVLRDESWTAEQWLPGALVADYDDTCQPKDKKTALTFGMAMTEKQGGSDLRANTTQAKVGADGEAELIGHKWFCSAPMSDAFLTLAYEDKGLSCFLVPKWQPDNTRNAIEIQRLKDKMGDHSNASSEIEYRGAWAKRVGEPGRGIPTIINMAHHTRFDCVSGSAAGMRKAVKLAVHHVSHRTAFQRKLIDQPLMQNTLADLALESEAAMALSFAVAASFDAAAGSAHTAAFSRVLTPIAKYWVCKRQPSVVAEALECLGGVGFVEESGLPNLFRTSPLNSVWEGSGNVIALDIQRALQDKAVALAFADEITRIGDEIPAIAPLTKWLSENPAADPRLFAERAAIVLASDALSAGSVRDGWINLRLMAPSHIWGGNAAQIDGAAILARVQGW